MKRIISMILALLMVMSSVLMMVACDNSSSGEDETKKPVNQGNENTDTVAHNVPKQDFEGETFNSLCFRMNTTNYYYFTDEEAAGDPIKEALWQRRRLVRYEY